MDDKKLVDYFKHITIEELMAKFTMFPGLSFFKSESGNYYIGVSVNILVSSTGRFIDIVPIHKRSKVLPKINRKDKNGCFYYFNWHVTCDDNQLVTIIKYIRDQFTLIDVSDEMIDDYINYMVDKYAIALKLIVALHERMFCLFENDEIYDLASQEILDSNLIELVAVFYKAFTAKIKNEIND